MQPEQVTQEKVLRVLQLWLETCKKEASDKKKASDKENKDPWGQAILSANYEMDKTVQDLDEIEKFVQNTPKRKEFTDFLKLLTNQRNKYSFAETVENGVKNARAIEIEDLEKRSEFLKTYSFYFVHRQELLKAAAEIYPDYQIGRISA